MLIFLLAMFKNGGTTPPSASQEKSPAKARARDAAWALAT